MTTLRLAADEPLAGAVTEAIRAGNVCGLRELLVENSGLATARITDAKGCERSLLHIATDWPGHLPRVAETIAALAEHGADVNARIIGPHTETPLHWAASCDDVAALDALLDRDADLEAVGAVIGGGTPMADAVAFAQWNAARRLLERGALTNLWQSAALGLMDRVVKECSEREPMAQEITEAFWCACHGGQRESAEFLLNRGADRNWIGWDRLTPAGAARRSGALELAAWLESGHAAAGKLDR